MKGDTIETPENEDDPEVVCPTCLLANDCEAAFCAACGAPIGMVTTLDPIQRIHAEGFAYRSAVDGPPKLIIVLGVWAIMVPLMLQGVLLAWLPHQYGDHGQGSVLKYLYGLFWFLAGMIIIIRTTRNYLSKRGQARLGGDE